MVYWTNFNLKDWHVTLAATEKGLLYVGLAEDSLERMKDWLTKQFGPMELIENADQLARYTEEMKMYLSGEVNKFTCPIDWQGTPFQCKVWEALQDIAYGKTATYSEITQAIGKPTAVRATAAAIGRNPLLLVIPCHRVVAKDGSLAGFRDGLEQKERLIQLEGGSSNSSR